MRGSQGIGLRLGPAFNPEEQLGAPPRTLDQRQFQNRCQREGSPDWLRICLGSAWTKGCRWVMVGWEV